MYKIAITAGGTSENVDGVRKLTNVSTGSLGWNCLEATLSYFLSRGDKKFRVFYILTPTAIRRELPKAHKEFVEFINVEDAESVFDSVDTLTRSEHITHFIHSMAISDFTFAHAVSVENLANELAAYFAQNKEANIDAIRDILTLPQSRYGESAKISSSEPILMGLKTTKKVIPLIKQNNPNTVLVGFKLLRDVSEDTLVDVANRLQTKNECDFVFANELSSISGDNHTGLLIKDGNIVARPTGKRHIADTIVEYMLNHK